MRSFLVFLVFTVAGCGSGLPVRIETNNRIALDGPVSGRITADLAPAGNHDPLVLMSVDGQPAAAQGARIGLVDVDGLILNANATGLYSVGENPVALLREKLDYYGSDPSVGAVVVRINSPGGSVAGSDMAWREVQTFRARTRKPVVACVMDVGCGGGYYLATAADQIYAHPGAVVGGIGVVLNLYNLQDLMAQFNVVPQNVKAGPNIDMGTTAAMLTPETRQLLQKMADEYHERFKAAVRQSRKQLSETESVLFDGRVFTARQAAETGLIDNVGYLDDALATARQLARQPDARPVLLRRPNDPARTPYAVTPNVPLQGQLFPLSIPGIDRSRLPTFMYAWMAEPTLERLAGK
jgi:protease-4